MRQRGMALLLPVLLLATACGSGTLVPAGQQPAPEPAPEPAAAPAPAVTEPVATAPETTATQPGETAYVPYGGATAQVQIRRIGQYSQSWITGAERLVIRDDSSYAGFWSRLGVGGERPRVDFSRDVVVAVAGGQRPTGGYSIAVDQVTRTGSGVTVDVVQTTPGAGCMMTQALTQPVDVVVLAAADARSWSFTDRMVEQGCQ